MGYATVDAERPDWSVSNVTSTATQVAGGALIVAIQPVGPSFALRGINWADQLGQSVTTMAIGGAWLATEPINDVDVMHLRWNRKVITSGRIVINIAHLPKRAPRTIVGDYSDE